MGRDSKQPSAEYGLAATRGRHTPNARAAPAPIGNVLAVILVILVLVWNAGKTVFGPREFARIEIGDELLRMTFSAAAPLGGDQNAVHIERQGWQGWEELMYVIEPDSIGLSAPTPDSLQIDIYILWQLYDPNCPWDESSWWGRGPTGYESVGEPYYLRLKTFTCKLDEINNLPDRFDVLLNIPRVSSFSREDRNGLRGYWLDPYWPPLPEATE